jgi:hypothetical protein
MPWLKWSRRNESLIADYGKEIRCQENANTIQQSRS